MSATEEVRANSTRTRVSKASRGPVGQRYRPKTRSAETKQQMTDALLQARQRKMVKMKAATTTPSTAAPSIAALLQIQSPPQLTPLISSIKHRPRELNGEVLTVNHFTTTAEDFFGLPVTTTISTESAEQINRSEYYIRNNPLFPIMSSI